MKNRGLLNLDEILKNNLSEEAGNESDTVNCEAPDETEVIKHYTNILLKYNPSLKDVCVKISSETLISKNKTFIRYSIFLSHISFRSVREKRYEKDILTKHFI